MLYSLVTVGLVAAAFLLDASRQPWLWRGAAIAWIAWMAFDGWRLARRHPGARSAQKLRPALAAIAVIVGIVAGYVAYGMAGNRVFASGETAQATGDCATATARYDLITGPFELTLSGNGATAERNRGYCDHFLIAVDRHDRGEFENAIAGYRDFLDETPPNSLDAPTHDRIQRAYLEWAQSARAAGDFPTATDTYLELLRGYRNSWSTEQARSELARTLVDEAQLLRSRFDANGGDAAVIDVRHAMQNLQLVLKDFGDTEAAAGVPKAITDTFNDAIRPFAAGKFCQALPTLEYLAGMPAEHTAGVVPTARDHHGKAAFECGLLSYGAGDFEEAVEHFETVLSNYPNHAVAAAAGSAYVAGVIAVEKPGTVPALPPPLAGNSPGSIKLSFFNDSSQPTEVLVAGPTAHRFTIPACPSCPVAYDNVDDACPTPNGRPTVDLFLRPGDYHVVSRDVDVPSNSHYFGPVRLRSTEIYCLYRGPVP